jgi:hypothetical protein
MRRTTGVARVRDDDVYRLAAGRRRQAGGAAKFLFNAALPGRPAESLFRTSRSPKVRTSRCSESPREFRPQCRDCRGL